MTIVRFAGILGYQLIANAARLSEGHSRFLSPLPLQNCNLISVPTLVTESISSYGVHDPSATVLSQAPNAFFSVSSLIKERKETICCLFLFCSM